jgi:hypothetical protein
VHELGHRVVQAYPLVRKSKPFRFHCLAGATSSPAPAAQERKVSTRNGEGRRHGTKNRTPLAHMAAATVVDGAVERHPTSDVDEWVAQLLECKHLSEENVRKLTERVSPPVPLPAALQAHLLPLIRSNVCTTCCLRVDGA